MADKFIVGLRPLDASDAQIGNEIEEGLPVVVRSFGAMRQTADDTS
jgi:hypothetical protein